MLEVSSPGLERPVRWHRHWVRFVGREVQATVAGLGRVRARIVAVPDEATVVLEPQGGAPRPVPLAGIRDARLAVRSEEHTSELQSRLHLVCRLLLEKKKIKQIIS